MSALSILAVDDEVPALDELSYLLGDCEMVGSVVAAQSATGALRRLESEQFDVLLLDIRMPGLDGLDLARILAKFSHPPAVVFVSAHEEHALEAFDVGAAGYLLKPLAKEQIEQVLQRIVSGQHLHGEDLNVLAVNFGDRTRMVPRDEVTWVESSGDYVRIHIRDGTSCLVRVPMSVLEERWMDHGFVRVHRSFLVALREIREIRTEGSRTSVEVAGHDLAVSRRHLRELRDRLVRHARPGAR